MSEANERTADHHLGVVKRLLSQAGYTVRLAEHGDAGAMLVLCVPNPDAKIAANATPQGV